MIILALVVFLLADQVFQKNIYAVQAPSAVSKPSGIDSPGQTCYLNSLFQSLLVCNPFTSRIDRDYKNNLFKGNAIATNVAEFFQEHLLKQSDSISSLKLYTCLSHAQFIGKERVLDQNDSHEAFLALIDSLSDPKKNGTDRSIYDLFTIGYSKKLFFNDGTSKTLSNKGTLQFWLLNLPSDETQVSLNDLMRSSLDKNPENFEYNDTDVTPHQHRIVIAQQLQLTQLPELLVIQLGRFDFDLVADRPTKLKNSVDVDFDLYLTVGGTKAHYRLVSTVLHVGSGIKAGHYIAVVRHDNRWYACDDSRVFLLEPAKAQDYVSSKLGYTAYLLFFERIDTVNSTPIKNTQPISALLGAFEKNIQGLYYKVKML